MREWLKTARIAKNLTMRGMAEKLDISESYYCFVENGERQKRMDIALASALSVILDIPLATIVEEERKLNIAS